MADSWGIRLEKDPSVVHREIAGESILVPVRSRSADLESIFTLNSVGSRIWALMDGERSLGEIRDLLAGEYDVPSQDLESDVLEFVEHLLEANVVREAA